MQLSTSHMIGEKDGVIGWMTFNNPERHNAISYEMRQAILEILADFERDSAVRVIVLKGAGERAFVSGSDISQFDKRRATPDQQQEYSAMSQRVQAAYEALTKPLVAMIRGYCLGGGLATALNADIRIAAEDAQFGIPAGRLGIAYNPDGVKRLVDLVGPSRTKEILFTAKRFSAVEAYDMGLINKVVPTGQLEATVRELAETIAANAPLSLHASKILVDEAVKDLEDRNLELCNSAVQTCMQSEDYKEGRTAFMEKRKPVWKGR